MSVATLIADLKAINADCISPGLTPDQYAEDLGTAISEEIDYSNELNFSDDRLSLKIDQIGPYDGTDPTLISLTNGEVQVNGELRIGSGIIRGIPIGGIIPFHPDIQSPALSVPFGFAPCNGATISDINSPLNGLTLPDLNSSAYGSSNRGRYLRGGNTSGLLNGSTFRKYSGGSSYGGSGAYYGAWVHLHYNLDGDPSGATSKPTYSSYAAAVDLTNTPYQVTAMTVVFIMRIK